MVEDNKKAFTKLRNILRLGITKKSYDRKLQKNFQKNFFFFFCEKSQFSLTTNKIELQKIKYGVAKHKTLETKQGQQKIHISQAQPLYHFIFTAMKWSCEEDNNVRERSVFNSETNGVFQQNYDTTTAPNKLDYHVFLFFIFKSRDLNCTVTLRVGMKDTSAVSKRRRRVVYKVAPAFSLAARCHIVR